jgi:hypothetical protein
VNWALKSHPLRAVGIGGRQVRTDPAYGNIFDHFAVDYEYPGGIHVTSLCRQIDGCFNDVSETIVGTKGICSTQSGGYSIHGEKPWRFSEQVQSPYVQEQIDLIESIRKGKPLNEARAVAESTLTAIMGRMSAYTGQEVTWEQAMNSKLDLTPEKYDFGSLKVEPVAVHGQTPLM